MTNLVNNIKANHSGIQKWFMKLPNSSSRNDGNDGIVGKSSS